MPHWAYQDPPPNALYLWIRIFVLPPFISFLSIYVISLLLGVHLRFSPKVLLKTPARVYYQLPPIVLAPPEIELGHKSSESLA